MKILFLHSNFPAQFIHLCLYLRQFSQHQVVFLTTRQEGNIPGIAKCLYAKKREASREVHPYLRSLENAVLEGQGAVRTALQLKQQGFIPDLIVGHSGWGSTLYMKDVFPDAAYIGYFEWFYRAHGSDVDFGGVEVSPNDEARIRMMNAPILVDLYSCDAGMTPTFWQHSQFPPEYAAKLRIVHDGIDCGVCSPASGDGLFLPASGLDLRQGEEIVTYVGRGMEPYRGFPQFIESVQLLLKRRPRCHVVIVGQDDVFYGPKLPNGKTFKEFMLEKVPLDMDRVHFTGYLMKDQYIKVLQASHVHVYLTRPFVLSWSLLEAMACGCTVVASQTAPVTEVINDGVNGILTDFFSPAKIADVVVAALDQPSWRRALGHRARETILDRYDVRKSLPRQLAIFNEVLEERKAKL